MSAHNNQVKLCLFLSVLLIGTGLFYPYLVAYRHRSNIESLMLAEDYGAAARLVDQLLLRNPGDSVATYYKAVLERRQGDESAYQQWRRRSEQAGAAVHMLDLQDKLLTVQKGQIDRDKEQVLVAEAQATQSDAIAAETFEAISRGYLSTYRLKEAWQCLEYWLQWRGNSVEARMMRGEILIRTGLPALAVKEYREILRTMPQHVQASERLANTLLKLNEVEEAEQLLMDVCQKPQASIAARIDLAEAQRRSGKLEEAAGSVKTALKLGVDSRQRGQCSSILGQLALVEQKPEKAIELLLVAVELIPEDATSHHALGSALAVTGRSELSEKHRNMAQQIRQQFEQVQTWTRKVIESPNDPELRVNIGQALLSQGLRSEGIAWIKTALVCDPNFQPAQQLLSELSTADAPHTP